MNVRPAAAFPITALVFVQMLPATLVVPAIRPLFALWHHGNEGAMHAFMGVNMLGAAVLAPALSRWKPALRAPLKTVALLSALDALTWLICLSPVSTPIVLGARALEGAAHVSATSLLMAEAARSGKLGRLSHVMGLVGAALLLAIAAGSAIGGLCVRWGPAVPFQIAAALSLVVAASSVFWQRTEPPRTGELAATAPRPTWATLRALAGVISVAFVARFTVGCVVVSFALFAHKVHALGDGRVGALFACMTLPFALLIYPASRLGDRVPRAVLLGGSVLLHGAALALLGWVPAAALSLVMLLAGTASAGTFAVVLCYSASAEGVSRSGAMAWVNAAGCLGMISGTAAGGIASAVWRDLSDPGRGHRAAFLVAAGALALWWLLALPWLRARYRKEVSSMTGAMRSAVLVGSGTQRTQ
ncbi:MAG: MFS transporter [Polyangiaceae bacterium]